MSVGSSLREVRERSGLSVTQLATRTRIPASVIQDLEKDNFSTKNRKINIYYIRSDLDLMGNIEKLQDKITFSILQEYTRSGLFNKFAIFDKVKIENFLENVSILDFDQKFNKLPNTQYYCNFFIAYLYTLYNICFCGRKINT